MPPRLDDHIREAILADVRAREMSCRAIAAKHGVSASTVSTLARAADVPDAFERAQTQKATEASAFDAKIARAELIRDLYGDAQRFRARAWSKYTQIVSGPMGPELVTTKLPSLADQKAGYTAMAICLDKAMRLEKFDDDGGAAAGRTMINDLFGAFQLAYHQMVAEEEPVDPETGLPASESP